MSKFYFFILFARTSSYLDYLDCTKKNMADLNGCDTRKVETMNSFTRSYLDNVLNFICGDYTGDNDKCSKLGNSNNILYLISLRTQF